MSPGWHRQGEAEDLLGFYRKTFEEELLRLRENFTGWNKKEL
jgi:hypothetical protein